jgi:dihydropteroate synthase
MGVLNVTPDSFYDGGRWMTEAGGPDVPRIVSRTRELVSHGADVVDIGGESTRPRSVPVEPDEELARVAPVLEALASLEGPILAPLCIDTRRTRVARAAMEAGAAIINDISGLADPGMAEVAAATGAGLVIGHLRGVPETMQDHIGFRDAITEVEDEICTAVDRAVAAGVERRRIVVDPGIGFGKDAEQSAALVAAADSLERTTGRPVMIGASRKSFLGVITARTAGDRLAASLAAAVIAVLRGARLVRVHDVRETVDALAVATAIEDATRALADARGAG